MSLLPASSSGEVSTGFYSGVATQSARFFSNHYMTKTPSSAGNRKQFTFSWWMKKNVASGYSVLYSTAVSGSNSNSTLFHLYADNSNGRISAGGVDFAGYTVGYQRDTTNWYHCVVVVDTDQSSNNDRVKIYINGIKNSAMSGTCPQSNLAVNSTQTYHIGRRRINSDRYANIYLADFYLIDGTAIGDTSRTNPNTGETEYVIDEFGEFNNGVWIPKAYSGSYGTNGYRMEFSGTGTSADSSGIGADTSGNTHHHSVSNFTANDSNIPDSPENNFPVFNPLQKDTTNSFATTTLSEGNLKSQNTAASNQYSEISFRLDTTNKYYFEYYNISNTGPYAPASFAIRDEENRTGNAVYFYITNSGTINVDNSNIGTGFPTLVAGDIMNIAFDGSSGKVWFGKNGTYYNSSGSESGSPADGTNPIATLTPATFLMHETFYQQGAIMNFGQDSSFAGNKTAQGNTDENGIGDFYYSVPSGFLAFCSANLPETTLSPDKGEQATNYFSTKLYTGNGSSRSITGVGFQPDLSWFKSRSNASDHYWYDSIRGANKSLTSNKSVVEDTTSGQFTSFDSDGFTLPDDTAGYVNYNARTYVAWNWRLNGGTTSSDTNGNRTTTIQTNANAGISIATYNNPSQGNHTFGHGLGSKPEAFIWRARNTVMNWIWWDTYNFTDADRDGKYFNETIGFTSGSNWVTDVTDSIIEITDGQVSSGNDIDYWCISYKSVPGFSKINNFKGNGSSDGPFFYTGFRPAWVMIKRIDVAENWWLLDNTRNTYNPVINYLSSNTNNQEYSNLSNVVDFTSNGVKVRTTTTAINANGSTYVYMAFAEQPFKFSNAR